MTQMLLKNRCEGSDPQYFIEPKIHAGLFPVHPSKDIPNVESSK
jgi:hypothetical protein